MGNTRDFKSLGIWAEDAVTPVPGSPTPFVAYRDETLTEGQNKAGEPFEVKPDSAQFNQKMFIITSYIDMLDKHGGIGWSDQVDYVVPAIAWGSDTNWYFALQASGPGTAVKDPISEPTYWELITSATQLRQDLANQTPGSEGAKLIGYNKFDVNGGVDVGLTVKQALDEVYTATSGLAQLRLVMSGHFDGTTGLALSDTFNVYQNKAFIAPLDSNPAVIGYTVFSDNATEKEFVASFLVFVTARAVQDPDLPAGNLIPTVLSVNPNVFLVPPSLTETRQGVRIFEYEIGTGISETQQLDFDVVVLAVDPVGSDSFP